LIGFGPKQAKKCKQYILKWDAVGSILKQTKRKHQLTIKACIKYVDKKSPVMRPYLQPEIPHRKNNNIKLISSADDSN
jgi:hypothetical protein